MGIGVNPLSSYKNKQLIYPPANHQQMQQPAAATALAAAALSGRRRYQLEARVLSESVVIDCPYQGPNSIHTSKCSIIFRFEVVLQLEVQCRNISIFALTRF